MIVYTRTDGGTCNSAFLHELFQAYRQKFLNKAMTTLFLGCTDSEIRQTCLQRTLCQHAPGGAFVFVLGFRMKTLY